ncbi:MAG TPA: alpha/beta hydrolase-fold protein [Candidatus Acidoferrales bacterium]|jgi:enterochelin esterase-like enzyme|nr:alpha/beta hydrolase-fold protein [Candidatus Acidoferrales bacterium]
MKITFGVMSLMLTLAVFAQPPASTPSQAPGRGMRGGRGPALRSPEILDDQKVTFRLRAPNASDVLLNGDWPEGRGVKMAKDDAGIWSATVGPLTPELWAYTFNVDGVSLLDSANANILRDGTRYSNFLIVDGALSDAYKIKDVPHGNVSLVWYDSPTLGSASPRRMYVYTPPGYDRSTARYPVLYLLHGAGGDEDAWNNMGRANMIMDNLIAANKVKPMLVVMTNGNANQKMGPGYGIVPGQVSGPTGNPGEVGVVGAFNGGRGAAPGPAPTPAAPASGGATAPAAGRGGGRGMSNSLFPESLVNDVVPYIEKNFRAIPNKDSRAIAGLSMGGGHTLTATNAHPDVFSYVGVFSMGTAADVSDKLEALKKAGVKFYYVGHGKDDPVVKVAQGQNLAAQLQKVGINSHYTESSGGHTWSNWRIYLSEFTPSLFK